MTHREDRRCVGYMRLKTASVGTRDCRVSWAMSIFFEIGFHVAQAILELGM